MSTGLADPNHSQRCLESSLLWKGPGPACGSVRPPSDAPKLRLSPAGLELQKGDPPEQGEERGEFCYLGPTAPPKLN